MKRRFVKRYGLGRSLSGGLRVEKIIGFGLIEVCQQSELLYGMHNERISRLLVPKGYRFNSLDMVGDWYDVIPIYYKRGGTKTKSVYMKRISDTVPYVEVAAWNRKLPKAVARPLYDK